MMMMMMMMKYIRWLSGWLKFDIWFVLILVRWRKEVESIVGKVEMGRSS